MIAFVLIVLIVTAAGSALLSLGDSTVRGVRSYKRLSASRTAGLGQRSATVTIIGDVPATDTVERGLGPTISQTIIRQRQDHLIAANAVRSLCAAA